MVDPELAGVVPAETEVKETKPTRRTRTSASQE